MSDWGEAWKAQHQARLAEAAEHRNRIPFMCKNCRWVTLWRAG